MNVPCSALPASLLESELFGHEKGAFTGAKSRTRGLVEQADGGTLFLDEIGEMELPLQAKILRLLEERSFRRVGGREDLRADVRFIAATNVDLRRAVREKRFREDLYFRLAVVNVELPPLRERDGDVDVLLTHFLSLYNSCFGTDLTLDRSARRLLLAHPWPGNVRELRNTIERAVLMADGKVLTAADFSFLDRIRSASVVTLPEQGVDLRTLEKDLLEQALARTSGNQTRAARLLGMNRDQVRYRIQRYGLSRELAHVARSGE